MRQIFPPKQNFMSLSVGDLLEARETFHVHLYNKENVIATAIGRFRIRKEDPDALDPETIRDIKDSPPRTLENTVVTPWSWPCILVFVNKWLSRDQMKEKPEQVVPRFIYMPDGRIIPLCVIYAAKKRSRISKLRDLTFTDRLVGGGYPVLSNVQGQQRYGTIGCLVTDGHSVFALTNKHVVGNATTNAEDNFDNEVYTIINEKPCKVGHAYPKQIGKKLFGEIYNGWPGKNIYSNVDAGLIKLEDVTDFTAQIFGIGEMGDLVDLTPQNITLDLVGCPVRAFGGASGQMQGEIQALFYRYKSMGGFDYVSDLIIGKIQNDNIEFITQPGDSGTLWFYDPRLVIIQEKDTDGNNSSSKDGERSKNIRTGILKFHFEDETTIGSDIEAILPKGKKAPKLQPIALQWGGQVLSTEDEENEHNFALATCLSTICRELDIDLVRNWNNGYSEYWGELGHYKVGSKAIDLLSNQKLLKLMSINSSSIAFDDDVLSQGNPETDPSVFVPLADVSDFIWKYKRGSNGEKEKPNHFADVDEEGTDNFRGRTLLGMFEDNIDTLNIDTWNEFYESINTEPKYRGSLPFRIWQIYNEMVKFLREKNLEKFVCAAGIISHYVGDSCQPLHSSRYHSGRPENPSRTLHSDYETKMLDRFSAEIIERVNTKLAGTRATPTVTGGKEAAISTMHLMNKVMHVLPPVEIIEVFERSSGRNKFKKMFEALGTQTIDCMSEGSLFLAELWESAWLEGGGDLIRDSNISTIDKEILKDLYNDPKFLESFQLVDSKYKDAMT